VKEGTEKSPFEGGYRGTQNPGSEFDNPVNYSKIIA
jgi:hypothetical protein